MCREQKLGTCQDCIHVLTHRREIWKTYVLLDGGLTVYSVTPLPEERNTERESSKKAKFVLAPCLLGTRYLSWT